MSKATRVLVVDDDDDIREGVSRWLSASGYETMTAEDGEDGVTVARAQAPDAILMDVLMPRKDGMQALADLRSDDETACIPVVMLSASLRDEQRALEAGARYFVHKPYEGKKLLATMRAALKPNPVG